MAHCPQAPFGIEHVPAREHAHVVGLSRGKLGEPVEVPAFEQDALGGRETPFVEVSGIVVDGDDLEPHVARELRQLAGRIGCPEQPHAHRVEQRNACPGEALELLIVHRRPARDVFHLEDVAGRGFARCHDLLRVVAEEDKRIAIGRTHLTVLLGHLIIHVRHGRSAVVHHLEAKPSQLAFVDGAKRAFERGDIGCRQTCGDVGQSCRRHMFVALCGIGAESGYVFGREFDWMPFFQGVDCAFDCFLIH